MRTSRAELWVPAGRLEAMSEKAEIFSAGVGTDLYRNIITLDYGDDDRKALMRKVWGATPWVLNVRTGPIDGDHFMEIRQWCHHHIGDESYPIHGRDGLWRTGLATIFGETFIGFATEELMNMFKQEFGEDVVSDRVRAL